MTSVFTEGIDQPATIRVPDGVYRPQEDSALLIEALRTTGRALGSRVADLCSGSGIVALAAAAQGAAAVSAFEMSPRAVTCARVNVAAAGSNVRVYRGSCSRAVDFEPFDVITCNPPYVPFVEDAADEFIPADAGPDMAWNAGRDGRRVLDPLCERAPEMLAGGGTILIVHSEFAAPTLDRADPSARSWRQWYDELRTSPSKGAFKQPETEHQTCASSLRRVFNGRLLGRNKVPRRLRSCPICPPGLRGGRSE